jgi:hypothetical protein
VPPEPLFEFDHQQQGRREQSDIQPRIDRQWLNMEPGLKG